VSGQAAKTETFELPDNASGVSIDASVYQGSGLGRLTVTDEAGETVHETKTYAHAGEASGETVGVSPGEKKVPEDLEPGTYTVNYQVTGSICFEVSVTALVPT